MLSFLLSPQVLSPTYKQRNEEFRRLFKKLPDTERLIVGELCLLKSTKPYLAHYTLYYTLKLNTFCLTLQTTPVRSKKTFFFRDAFIYQRIGFVSTVIYSAGKPL